MTSGSTQSQERRVRHENMADTDDECKAWARKVQELVAAQSEGKGKSEADGSDVGVPVEAAAPDPTRDELRRKVITQKKEVSRLKACIVKDKEKTAAKAARARALEAIRTKVSKGL